MATYLITGAGRGVGLELTRQLSSLPVAKVSKVFATTRGQPPDTLRDLIASSSGRVVHISCEVTVPESAREAATTVASELGSGGLDVLINNVGVSPPSPRKHVTPSLRDGQTP